MKDNKDSFSWQDSLVDWPDYTENSFPITTFREVSKLDLLSSSTALCGNEKSYLDDEMLSWLRHAERNSRIPQNFEEKINLKSNNLDRKKCSYRSFKNKKIAYDDFSSLMYKAYGYDEQNNTRGYGSGGGLYPINVIIFVLEDNAIEDLKRGVYYFYPLKNCIYRLNSFNGISSNKLNMALYPNRKKPYSNIAIGYAADLRKCIRKYQYLGYKNALIEIGLMIQALKTALPQNMGEFSCQDFNNRLLTTIADLDKRNAPIEIIQWIGRID
ncbi:nitroreductase family protein [Lactobacillus crispatus]|uniref:SagB/ThcOx family dehydrogenase n=2 Tax=Lactobacillus crispatus TaxID=47770 RepID=D5H027_LACCS|nr:hypothetical protein [Lactobacillus crispatus]QLL74893.1 hypothetical protein GTO85_11410 [Lactobacillus crispatus]CBL51386.1 putative protein without homology [Lactobacillus crispatus ST1]